uniref:Glu-AdT subunit C n=1 Tax=Oryza rufipogon TaxID=4529 RepID=A0A0E0NYY9_ORYRU
MVAAAAAFPLLLTSLRDARYPGGGGGGRGGGVSRRKRSAHFSISLAEEFAPKIRQVVDWFGQLQAVDLESVEPSLRAGTAAGNSLREDRPETFTNRDAIIESVPSYDDPYIKVPRVLNKE